MVNNCLIKRICGGVVLQAIKIDDTFFYNRKDLFSNKYFYIDILYVNEFQRKHTHAYGSDRSHNHTNDIQSCTIHVLTWDYMFGAWTHLDGITYFNAVYRQDS